tara:strand:- start:206 stop:595 length:390 start_codon:yes stop_codon:yes gene_type:complete
MLNYFLIKDSCRDGDHEYYDYVPVETTMTSEDLRNNKNFWEESFLGWQWHYIEQDESNDWWSGMRIVSIYDWKPITKEQYEVLDDVIGAWSLDQIIEQGEENWLPHEDNYEHYGLDDLIPCTEYNKEKE